MNRSHIRFINVVLLLIIPFSLLHTTTLYANTSKTIVRVGVFDSSFDYTSSMGYREGYAYDYLQEIAAHTGWEYSYVEGSWTELMFMLEDGEIDLISDVSYLPEREEHMLFSATPMGYERYYIFTHEKDNQLYSFDPTILNGKQIGITGFNIAKDYYTEWATEQNISAELLEYDDDEYLAQAVEVDEIEYFIATDAFNSLENCTPICLIGSSDIYFAINKNHPELKRELDDAMAKILDESPYYHQELNEKYIIKGVSKFLPQDEVDWINNKKIIKVGYRDNYLPFCATDTNGELTGALKEYLEMASQMYNNVEIHYQPVPYKTTDEALAALARGEIDCVFPIEYSKSSAERDGFLVSHKVVSLDVIAIIGNTDFSLDSVNTVAIDAGNCSYREFVTQYYPNWKTLEVDSLEQAFTAVSKDQADCLLIYNYRIGFLQKNINRNNLFGISTGVGYGASFVLRRDDSLLYSILNRTVEAIPESNMHSLLSYYAVSKKEVTPEEAIRQYFIPIVIVIFTTLIVILGLLFRVFYSVKITNNLNKELKNLLADTEEQKEQLEETLQKYYRADIDRRTDFLTGLRNRQDLYDFLSKSQIDGESTVTAIYMMDIDDFKSFNDNYGHVQGDYVLKTCSKAIKQYGEDNNIVFFRYGGEEFLGVLQNSSEEIVPEIADEIVSLIRKLNISREDNANKKVTISLGYSTYCPSIDQMINQADHAMYQAKKQGKNCAIGYGAH